MCFICSYIFPMKTTSYYIFPMKTTIFPIKTSQIPKAQPRTGFGLHPAVAPAPPRQHVALQRVGWCRQHSSEAPLASRWTGDIFEG